MILKSLYDYAQAHSDTLPPMGMEWKEIEYVIVIDKEGRFVRFESRRIDKKRCQRFLVPKGVKRTSAPLSNILWDNSKYVLGIGKNAHKCKPLFIDIVKQLAARHQEDPTVTALKKFYELPEHVLTEAMQRDPLYQDVVEAAAANFSFRCEGDDILIVEKRVLYEDLLNPTNDEDPVSICLVTGNHRPIIKTMTATPLPDNSPMASLVSFQVNSGYDSYGKQQVYNAPICYEAEGAIANVLKLFLGKDSKNKMRLGDRMLLFWGSGKSKEATEFEEGLGCLFSLPDKGTKPEEQLSQLLQFHKLVKSVYSGQITSTLEDRFHILGLAPNTGRIAVVLWMDTALREFASHILSHMEDMEIVDNRKEDKRKPYVGAYSMISGATLGGKVSDATPRTVEETVKAIIQGTPYPFQLYTATLQRIRAELADMGVTVGRAAFLKAYINRKTSKNNKSKQLTVMLDKENTNPGYLCGRLTAVLEKIQSDVNSGDSIRTRYMGAASTTPAAVFPAMLNLSLHHSDKLSEGSRIYYEQLKQEIVDKIPMSGFPAHLDLNDQGRFFVGYYHQRTDLFTKKESK